MSDTQAAAFEIVLQKGLQLGCFIPSTPDVFYRLTHDSNSDVFLVSKHARPHGTLLPHVVTNQELKVADHTASIARLQEVLRVIPTQYPGAPDRYGRNTTILDWRDYFTRDIRGDLQMSASQAEIEFRRIPTKEERAMFDEAITIIESFVAYII